MDTSNISTLRWVYISMEVKLELLFADRLRPLTSASKQVTVSFNGSLVVCQPPTNMEARLVGVETLSFMVLCRARSRQDVHNLAAEVKQKLGGLRPASVNPLLFPAWFPSTAWMGEAPDGYWEIGLTLTIKKPYIQETSLC